MPSLASWAPKPRLQGEADTAPQDSLIPFQGGPAQSQECATQEPSGQPATPTGRPCFQKTQSHSCPGRRPRFPAVFSLGLCIRCALCLEQSVTSAPGYLLLILQCQLESPARATFSGDPPPSSPYMGEYRELWEHQRSLPALWALQGQGSRLVPHLNSD